MLNTPLSRRHLLAGCAVATKYTGAIPFAIGMALILADARRFIDADAGLEEPIKSLVRTLIEAQYQRLGWELKQDEPSEDVKLRATIIALGVYAEHQPITERALELWEAYKKDTGAVDSELAL